MVRIPAGNQRDRCSLPSPLMDQIMTFSDLVYRLAQGNGNDLLTYWQVQEIIRAHCLSFDNYCASELGAERNYRAPDALLAWLGY